MHRCGALGDWVMNKPDPSPPTRRPGIKDSHRLELSQDFIWCRSTLRSAVRHGCPPAMSLSLLVMSRTSPAFLAARSEYSATNDDRWSLSERSVTTNSW